MTNRTHSASRRSPAVRELIAFITLIVSLATPCESALVFTRVSQLRELDFTTHLPVCSVDLRGTILWANFAEGTFVLKDDSGSELIEIELQDRSLKPGQIIELEGTGVIFPKGGRYRIGVKGPVVVNDGTHSMVEKIGIVFLPSGRHPIRLEWFNSVEGFGLEVKYAGPGIPLQRIPDGALFRSEQRSEGSAERGIHGLNYNCYQGVWNVLPDFDALTPIDSGTVRNFDLSVRTRDQNQSGSRCNAACVGRTPPQWLSCACVGRGG